MKTSLLAVLGNDRPGIIAGLTEILFRTRCNLEDISMTVLEGEFAMMVVVSYEPRRRDLVDSKLKSFCTPRKLTFFWKDLGGKKSLKTNKSSKQENVMYIISAIGRDRTGIVYQVSRELSAEKLNIQDLNSKILSAGTRNPVYAMVLEVAVPARYEMTKLETRLKKAAKKMKIDLTVKRMEPLEL